MTTIKSITKEEPTCLICVEPFNKIKNSVVSCDYCQFEACRACCQTFLLNETIEKCMNNSCGKNWSRKFITDTFPSTFVTGALKKHKEEVLFERERGMLPATQVLVENEIMEEKYTEEIKKNIQKRNNSLSYIKEELNKNYHSLQAVISLSMNSYIYEILLDEKDIKKKKESIKKKEIDLLEKKHTLSLEKRRLELYYDALEREIMEHYKVKEKEKTERKVFVRACSDENCRGFLSTQWKCGTCEKYSCSECHLLKGSDKSVEHTCNADDVATAKLLASDTKPCPNCRTGIFKIMGCDMMFCTQCHTGFSWKTGRIETNIHNPHYFEWVRRTGGNRTQLRNPNEVICGREIDNNFVNNLMAIFKLKKPRIEEQKRAQTIARCVAHITSVEIPRFAVNNMHNNERLRIKYMRGKITEEEFKKSLQKDNKAYEKNREISDVLVMLRNTITDILYRYYDEIFRSDKKKIEKCCEILDEIAPLLIYVNECLALISKAYGSVKLIVNFAENQRGEIIQSEAVIKRKEHEKMVSNLAAEAALKPVAPVAIVVPVAPVTILAPVAPVAIVI